MMRFIAPAGTPIGAADLLAGLSAGMFSGASGSKFRELLSDRSNCRHVWLTSSGRAAMSLALEAMQRIADPRRRQVVIAGYTCYSVPAAVERAGLEIRLCDVDPKNLSMRTEDLRKFDFSKVLCIVSANLYGMPNNLLELEQFAADRGVFLLDDAAQSLGARLEGRPAGGFGDVGLYSFDKGKNITTMQGGALASRHAHLATKITELLDRWPAPSLPSTLAYAAKLSIYSMLLKPAFYGITQKLPFLGLGRTPYELTCPQTQLSECLSGLGLRLARKLDDINRNRQQNALRLREHLEDIPGVKLIDEVPGSECVYSRFPIRILDPTARNSILEGFRRAGIGATCSYPNALADVPELSGKLRPEDAYQPGARAIAHTIVTLPTHAYCPRDLGERARNVLLNSFPH